MAMGWKIMAGLGFALLGAVILWPIVALALAFYERLSAIIQERQERRALIDALKARTRNIEVQQRLPDEHGFLGVAFDQASRRWINLDTNEVIGPDQTDRAADGLRLTAILKQRLLAALTGTHVNQHVVQEIAADEKPRLRFDGDDGPTALLTVRTRHDGGDVEL